MPTAADPLLTVEDLRVWFYTDAGIVRAVDGVAFDVRPGETLGIVGESGSGKSVTAKSIMRLLEDPARIVSGTIRFRGKDMVTVSEAELRDIRGAEIAMVFQDPMTSLNPVLRIARQLIETMTAHKRFSVSGARDRGADLLARMGIANPVTAMHGWPHQFSGGMRQRVMLAVGMSNEPALLIADEPTTALDVTIQAQILELLRELNRDFGTAIVLISHDLGVIARVCARTIVMYGGEVVEEGSPADLLRDPRHPYTWALLHAAPRLGEAGGPDRRLTAIEGQPPDPRAWPEGCRFRARCPFAIDVCTQHPDLLAVGPDRRSRLGNAAGRCAACTCGVSRLCGASRKNPGLAVARSFWPSAAFPVAEDRLSGPAARVAGAGRRRSHGARRRDRGSCRRIRFGQIDVGPSGDASGHAHCWFDPLRGPGYRIVRSGRDPAIAAAPADDFSGPVRVAQPTHDGAADPGGSDIAAPAGFGHAGVAPARGWIT